MYVNFLQLNITFMNFRGNYSDPHTSTSELFGVIDHSPKIMRNLRVLQEFNNIDYSMSLYGSCNRPSHDK